MFQRHDFHPHSKLEHSIRTHQTKHLSQLLFIMHASIYFIAFVNCNKRKLVSSVNVQQMTVTWFKTVHVCMLGKRAEGRDARIS